MTKRFRAVGAVLSALLLTAMVAGSALAVDYSSQVAAQLTTATADALPVIAAAVLGGLALWGALFGASLVFTGMRTAKKGKGGG